LISRKEAVIQSAVAALFSGGLYSLSLVVPAGMAAALFCPLPLALLAWRGNAASGALMAVLAAALISSFAPAEAVAYLAQFGLGAFIIGYGVRKGWTPDKTIGGFAAISCFATLLLLAVLANAASQPPGEFIAAVAGEWKAQIGKTFSEELSEIPADEVALFTERLESAAAFVVRSFPGILAALSLLVGWANTMMLRSVLKKREEVLADWRLLRLPANLIWVLIASGALTALGKGELQNAGINILIPVATVYFFQGIAIVHYLFETRKTPRLISWPVYAIIMINMPVAPIMVATLGAFDLWADFRSKIVPPAVN
jgi:hypothetical protein